MHANKILMDTIQKIDGAYAPSSIRAYRANFARYIDFCESISASPLPSDSKTVAKYIQKLTATNLKSASIRLATASISTIHKLNQFPDPTQEPETKLELRRMHRTLGRASKQALGITEPIVEKMIQAMKGDLRGLRDKALILLAYDSLCRRSELILMRLEDIEFNESGAPTRIQIRRSKTDQEAAGKIIRLNTKTQEAIKNWVYVSGIKEGSLFRGISNNGKISLSMSPGQINRIYKLLATKANLPIEQIKNISGHSFRVGKTQDLVSNGSSFPEIMHKVRISGQRDHPFQVNDRSFQSERDRLFQIQRDRFCAFL